MDSSSDRLVGSSLSGGRYRILAKLGEGGMGFVYRAHDANLDTEVVVKMPRRNMLDDPEFAERFALEVRALVRLTHPHIVRVSDVGTHEGLPFAVMQYLPGGSLEDLHALGGDRPARPGEPGSLSRWLPAVAAALDFAHSQGYIHRDVKPPNILFDAQGNAFLGDFGVAKLLAAMDGPSKRNVTGTGMVLGTPGYMAPELILGEPPDGRADQYGLAVTAYEALSGRRPFEHPTPTAVLMQQTSRDAPALLTHRPELPAALSEVIGRALSREPSGRFPDCASFASAAVAAAGALAGTSARAGSVPRTQPLRPPTQPVMPSRPATPTQPVTPPSRSSATIPVATGEKLSLTCPLCNASLKAFTHMRGSRLKCPSCKAKLLLAEDLSGLVPAPPRDASGDEIPLVTGTGATMKQPVLNRTVQLSAAELAAAAPEALAPRVTTIVEPLNLNPGKAKAAAPRPRNQTVGVAVAVAVAAVAVAAVAVTLRSRAPEPAPAPTVASVAPIAPKPVARPSSVVAAPATPAPAPAPKKPSRREYNAAVAAMNAGSLPMALQHLAAYLDQDDLPDKDSEEALSLQTKINEAQSDEGAREVLSGLTPEQLDEFEARGQLPDDDWEAPPALKRARLATLRKNVAAVKASRAKPPSDVAAAPRGMPTRPSQNQGPQAVEVKDLLTDLRRYEGQVVIPTVALVIATRPNLIGGQQALAVSTPDGTTLSDGRTLGGKLPIVLSPEIAGHLSRFLGNHPNCGADKPTFRSILKMEVRRIDAIDRLVAAIVEMKILVECDYALIGQKKYDNAFGVLQVTPGGVAPPDSQRWKPARGETSEWRSYLGRGFFSRIEEQYLSWIRKQRNQVAKARVGAAVGNAIAQSQRESAAFNQSMSQVIQRNSMGRPGF